MKRTNQYKRKPKAQAVQGQGDAFYFEVRQQDKGVQTTTKQTMSQAAGPGPSGTLRKSKHKHAQVMVSPMMLLEPFNRVQYPSEDASAAEESSDDKFIKKHYQVHKRTRGGGYEQRQQHDYSSEDYLYQHGPPYYERYPQHQIYYYDDKVYTKQYPAQRIKYQPADFYGPPGSHHYQYRPYATGPREPRQKQYVDPETESDVQSDDKQKYQSSTLTKQSRVLRRGRGKRVEQIEEKEEHISEDEIQSVQTKENYRVLQRSGGRGQRKIEYEPERYTDIEQEYFNQYMDYKKQKKLLRKQEYQMEKRIPVPAEFSDESPEVPPTRKEGLYTVTQQSKYKLRRRNVDYDSEEAVKIKKKTQQSQGTSTGQGRGKRPSVVKASSYDSQEDQQQSDLEETKKNIDIYTPKVENQTQNQPVKILRPYHKGFDLPLFYQGAQWRFVRQSTNQNSKQKHYDKGDYDKVQYNYPGAQLDENQFTEDGETKLYPPIDDFSDEEFGAMAPNTSNFRAKISFQKSVSVNAQQQTTDAVISSSNESPSIKRMTTTTDEDTNIDKDLYKEPVTMDLAKKFFLQESDDNPQTQSETMFEKYISDPDSLKKALEQPDCRLFKGTVRMSAKLRQTRAYVSIDELKIDIVIEGFKNMNRAMDGDVVIVELLPVMQWMELTNNKKQTEYTNETAIESRKGVDLPEKTEKQQVSKGNINPQQKVPDEEEILSHSSVEKQGKIEDIEVEVVQQQKESAYNRKELKGLRQEVIDQINSMCNNLRPAAKIVGLQESPVRKQEILATLIEIEIGGQEDIVLAQPINSKLPMFQLEALPIDLIQDKKVERDISARYYVIEFTDWQTCQKRPNCRVVESLGEGGNLRAETLRLLKNHDICTDQYREEAQFECLKPFKEDWEIPEDEIKRRLDLRGKRIFSVDPLTAKDLDDCLSLDKISDTVWEIGVHIADVSYFVPQGTDLDKEALKRSTTTYFVHEIWPMLPKLLSEKLCSLNPNVERLAYSIFYKIDLTTGQIIPEQKPLIQRSVIKSCAKWNYELAQQIIDGEVQTVDDLPENMKPQGHDFLDLAADILKLNELTQVRRKQRIGDGSLILTNTDFNFKLNPQTNYPVAYKESPPMQSKQMIEECMLLANCLVAEFLFSKLEGKTIVRKHEELSENKKLGLANYFQGLGLTQIDLTDSKSLNESIKLTIENKDEEQKEMLLDLINRKLYQNLSMASYITIGNQDVEDYRHFGLNFDLYTHFTSPIRRYADLLVHRLLTICLQDQNPNLDGLDYSEYVDLISRNSYNARRASKDCVQLFHCLMLKDHGPRVFDALIFDIEGNWSINIFIKELNLDLVLNFREDNRVQDGLFNDDEMQLILKMKKDEAKLDLSVCDKIKVKLVASDKFPLTIKPKIMFTDEDLVEFEAIKKEQIEKMAQLDQLF